EGFEVEEAATGRAALASAQNDPPDMIVLDIILPVVGGSEVTRRLRAAGIRVPVVFLTARDAVEDKVAGLTVGGDDYVTKPFSLEELVARLRGLIRRTGVTVVQPDAQIVVGDLVLDEDSHEVRRSGDEIVL